MWNQNRSIDVVDGAAVSGAVTLPLAGTIAAGKPLEAVRTAETLSVPIDMIAGRGNTFVLKVRGDSMINEQIRDGDFVIVEERQTARDGETVVALIDGCETTLKRFYDEGEQVRLEPAHPEMKPVHVLANRIRVQGLVAGVIRKH